MKLMPYWAKPGLTAMMRAVQHNGQWSSAIFAKLVKCQTITPAS